MSLSLQFLFISAYDVPRFLLPFFAGLCVCFGPRLSLNDNDDEQKTVGHNASPYGVRERSQPCAQSPARSSLSYAPSFSLPFNWHSSLSLLTVLGNVFGSTTPRQVPRRVQSLCLFLTLSPCHSYTHTVPPPPFCF